MTRFLPLPLRLARLLVLGLLLFVATFRAEEPLCSDDDAASSPEEANGECQAAQGAQDEHGDGGEMKWWMFSHTLDEFEVAGVNLASYDSSRRGRETETVDGAAVPTNDNVAQEQPFELYEDFDIGHLVKGDETWTEIIAYRNALERPSLSFYVDKVARKRWLPQQGFAQPETYVLKYLDELTSSSSSLLPEHESTSDEQRFLDEVQAIQDLLPADKSYAAKPTHMSLLMGNWLVDYNENGQLLHYSRAATELQRGDDLDLKLVVASSLARSLHQPAAPHESWALKNVKPGLVVEERYMAHDNPLAPPHEFNLFTIWGRLWVGQWNFIMGNNRYSYAFIFRNGTTAGGSAYGHQFGYDKVVPDWIPWEQLVELAETLGAHKDMFRTDVFVGIPKGGGATEVKIAVSESEIFPTTVFGRHEDDVALPNEAARLWVAGYKIGNYKVIPNNEVPADYVQTNN